MIRWLIRVIHEDAKMADGDVILFFGTFQYFM